jgi:hypothetical protein
MKRKSKDEVSIDVVEIGPDTTPSAKERLATCSSNRNHTLKHVNAFVYLIKQGKFRNYGFIFSNGNGDFYDAQNRLRALIKAGYTAKFLVVRGLSPDDMNMMTDSGKKRSNAQRLAKRGYINASLLCASVEECLDLETHWKRHVSMLFPDQIVDYLDRNAVLADYAKEWASNQKVIKPIPARLLVALQYLTGKIDAQKCDQFFFKFKQGAAKLKEGEPLRAFFVMLRVVENEENAHTRNLYIKNGLIQAWNAFYKDGENAVLETIEPSTRVISVDGLKMTPITEIIGDVGDLEGDTQSSEEEEAAEEEGEED